MTDERTARRLALLRRKRAALAPEPQPVSSSPPPTHELTAAQRAEPRRGWYTCCKRPFYVGYGYRKAPLCPDCGKQSRQALTREVHPDA